MVRSASCSSPTETTARFSRFSRTCLVSSPRTTVMLICALVCLSILSPRERSLERVTAWRRVACAMTSQRDSRTRAASRSPQTARCSSSAATSDRCSSCLPHAVVGPPSGTEIGLSSQAVAVEASLVKVGVDKRSCAVPRGAVDAAAVVADDGATCTVCRWTCGGGGDGTHGHRPLTRRLAAVHCRS